MAESGEERASHEEVETFVGKLREFHGSLNENEQGMMDEVLDSAQGGETAGFRRDEALRGGLGGVLERPGRLDRGAGRRRHPGV